MTRIIAAHPHKSIPFTDLVHARCASLDIEVDGHGVWLIPPGREDWEFDGDDEALDKLETWFLTQFSDEELDWYEEDEVDDVEEE